MRAIKRSTLSALLGTGLNSQRAKIIFYFFLTICFLFTWYCQYAVAATTGEKAADLEVINGASNTVHHLSDFRGKVLVVSFWATWCPPCQEEMPSIQSLYNRFRNDQQFQMVNVLYRDDYEKAVAYMKERNYDYPLFLDNNNKTAASYGVTGVPESFVIDKHGVIRKKVIGGIDWSSQESISLISSLLNESMESRPTGEHSASHREDRVSQVIGGLCGSFVLIIAAIFILNIALLVWVAKDAKNRGMGSAVGWIFLILFTGIIGLIIYLFSRPKGELVICDACGNKKSIFRQLCPHCGNASGSLHAPSDRSSRPLYCMKCGNKVAPDALFCIDCGGKVIGK